MEQNKVDYSKYYIKNNHNVSNKPSKKHREKGNKSKANKGKFTGKILTLAVILVMICLTILIADTIRGGYIISTLASSIMRTSHLNRTYYAVEVRTLEDINSARVYANEMRAKGGAGYVVFDDGYRVLVEVYDKKSDAEDVQKKLKLSGENARIYPFEIASVNLNKYGDNARNLIETSLKYNEIAYEKLHNIGMDLACSNIDDNSAKLRVKGIKDEIHNIINEFGANMKDGDEKLVKIKAELVSIEAMLQNLSEGTVKRPNLLSDIRYTSCLIVASYRVLTEELDK